MANLKISELPVAALPLNADDLLVVVQTGTTNQIPFSGITYSSVKNATQSEDWGGGTALQTITSGSTIGSTTITCSGNAPVLVIFSVTYKCTSGTTADSTIELYRDASPLGVRTFANISNTDYYTASLQMRDNPGAAGDKVYEGFFNVQTAGEWEIHGYSITCVEL